MDRGAFARQVQLAGPFQQLVMLAIVRLGEHTNATAIHRHLQAVTGRRISLTAVHTTLGRLAHRGYVVTWKREPFGRDRWFRDDRPGSTWAPRNIRCFFQVTAQGRRALRLTLAAVDGMRPGLPGLGREDDLFSWTRLPDPDPRFERLVRRVHRRLLGPVVGAPDPVELEATARILWSDEDWPSAQLITDTVATMPL